MGDLDSHYEKANQHSQCYISKSADLRPFLTRPICHLPMAIVCRSPSVNWISRKISNIFNMGSCPTGTKLMRESANSQIDSEAETQNIGIRIGAFEGRHQIFKDVVTKLPIVSQKSLSYDTLTWVFYYSWAA